MFHKENNEIDPVVNLTWFKEEWWNSYGVDHVKDFGY
jgi:hypothetical protein